MMNRYEAVKELNSLMYDKDDDINYNDSNEHIIGEAESLMHQAQYEIDDLQASIDILKNKIELLNTIILYAGE